MLELGAIELLREEVFLIVCSDCLVDSHVTVVVRLLAGSDLVKHADRERDRIAQAAIGSIQLESKTRAYYGRFGSARRTAGSEDPHLRITERSWWRLVAGGGPKKKRK